MFLMTIAVGIIWSSLVLLFISTLLIKLFGDTGREEGREEGLELGALPKELSYTSQERTNKYLLTQLLLSANIPSFYEFF